VRAFLGNGNVLVLEVLVVLEDHAFAQVLNLEGHEEA
jgi:hypothetical protein